MVSLKTAWQVAQHAEWYLLWAKAAHDGAEAQTQSLQKVDLAYTYLGKPCSFVKKHVMLTVMIVLSMLLCSAAAAAATGRLP